MAEDERGERLLAEVVRFDREASKEDYYDE
jgi:hypothetical protein